ncbi:sulfate/molybdate ABC transporter ATP-binding protein [Glaciibacter superstes]|uniref:sulfate/molybdate ABC transporter ATP-binding protein n=1 Tax=Glaciibacter superstes TaxID=501023 RepID=UPI0003B5D109|nr:ABC transporter ATP-binding protein [Glaciibacter superstes]
MTGGTVSGSAVSGSLVSGSLEANLLIRRGEFTLDAAVHVEPGEVLALLGPNGSGKSTMLAAIAGLIVPHSGSVSVAGRTLTRVAPGTRTLAVVPEKRGVGLLGQDPLLFPHLDSLDNIAFGRRSAGVGRTAARRDAADWLGAVGLAGFEGRKPSQLSGGQQQRVALARALAARPDVLLLDEPMAALDVETAPMMRRLLRERLADQGIATLLVTHDVLDAIVLADRVAILHEGTIVDEGQKDRVLGQPRNRFAAALAGVNLVSGVADADGVRLPDGRRFEGSHPNERSPQDRVPGDQTQAPHAHAAPVDAADRGTPAAAIFRPSSVRLSTHPPDESSATVLERGSANCWRSTIAVLEPSSGGIACRLADDQGVTVELPPARVSELGLEEGTEVWLSVDPADVTILGTR